MGSYLWESYYQEVSYYWKGFLSFFAYKPRWSNPTCDVRERPLAHGLVTRSEKVAWPEEFQGVNIGTTPPRQTPYQGSVGGGHPLQECGPGTRSVRVDHKYGGTLIENGVDTGIFLKGGNPYYVNIPVPVRNGWAVQGYPNRNNTGDRHWYGLDQDGNYHTVIQWFQQNNTVGHYEKWDSNGTLLHGYRPGGTTVKGGICWPAHAVNTWELENGLTHRLGIVFPNLGNDPQTGHGDGTGDSANWTVPSYGQILKLSEEEYQRQLSLNPSPTQKTLLDSMFFNGIVPFDRGGQDWAAWHGTLSKISGAQWVNSPAKDIGDLEIPLTELEVGVEYDSLNNYL